VIAYYQRIQAELQELNAGVQSIEALEQAEKHVHILTETCSQLTQLRQVAAAAWKLTGELKL